MAARIESGAYLGRGTPIISAASPYTWCGWFKLNSDRNAAGAICCLLTSVGTWIHGLRVDTDGTALLLKLGANSYSTGVNLSVGTWVHLAYTRSSNTFAVYVNGAAVFSQTFAVALTAAGYLLGSDGGAYVNGDHANTLVAQAT